MPPNILTLKELLEIIHDIKSTKDKMLAADPDLERSMATCQGIEKILFSNRKLYNVKTSSIQTTLDTFFTNKHFLFLMF